MRQKKETRTAQVATLLLGRQLVLEVHARRAGLDHGLRYSRRVMVSGCAMMRGAMTEEERELDGHASRAGPAACSRGMTLCCIPSFPISHDDQDQCDAGDSAEQQGADLPIHQNDQDRVEARGLSAARAPS